MKSAKLFLLFFESFSIAYSVNITFQTIPAGRTFVVDGIVYSSTQTFDWTAGSPHTMDVPSPQVVGTGTRYIWTSWSDGRAMTRTIIAPSTPSTYTSNFGTQYYLSMIPTSNWIGCLPVSGWYKKDSTVVIQTYRAGSMSEFLGWTGTGVGSYTGLNVSAQITMGGPITEIASWSSCTIAVQPSSASFDHTGGSGSFRTTVAANCNWTVLFKPDWVQTEYVSGGLNYTVFANSDTLPRTGQIGLSVGFHSPSATFDVHQASSRPQLTAVVGATEHPQDFELEQNYPNPFNPTTMIRFALPKTSPVLLEVYNSLGQPVQTLVNEVREAGSYSQLFDAHTIASGVYFYRLQAGDFVAARKLILVR